MRNQSPLQCFYVNNHRHILHRHSGVTLVLTQCIKNITLILLLSLEHLLLCQQDYRVLKGCRTSRGLTITFWNEIILDEIIEDHILKSKELRVNITRALCALAPLGLHLQCSISHSSSCNSSTPSRIPALASSLRPLLEYPCPFMPIMMTAASRDQPYRMSD